VQYDELAFSNVVEALTYGAAVVKITDFGMAVRMDSDKMHVSDVQRGTFFYMAPETKQNHQLHPASDVYAFGIMMWELVMGTLVYYARYSLPSVSGTKHTHSLGPALNKYLHV
jgi:serine/threonine protein kinase